MRILITGLMVALAVAELGACTVGPEFRRPEASAPARWTTDARMGLPLVQSRLTEEKIDPHWWHVFHDAELSSLIDRVATSSLDVQAATARLMQARAEQRVVGAAGGPAVDASASWQHARSSANGLLDISGLNGKADYNVWQPGIDASWEIDLWGRVRRERESADASAEAAADLRRDVLVSVLAETARDYLNLRSVQAAQAITQQNLDIARHVLDLTRIRVQDGVATRLDIAEAAAQVATIEAQLPILEQRRVHLINALSDMLGERPRALEGELQAIKPIPPVPPMVPAGLPSELAERRPDIRQAEAQLHAATADIGVAVGDFYPRITLSANLSLQAMHLDDLDRWSSRAFGIGPALSVPVFEGGRLRGQLALRKAQQQEAAIHFQRTVLRAWHEVDDVMTDYASSQLQQDRLTVAVAQNHVAFDNAQRQYVAGATDFLNVMSVQRELLATQQALVASTADVSLALVGLYKALGGGWETTFPVLPAASDEVADGQGKPVSVASNHPVSTGSSVHEP